MSKSDEESHAQYEQSQIDEIFKGLESKTNADVWHALSELGKSRVLIPLYSRNFANRPLAYLIASLVLVGGVIIDFVDSNSTSELSRSGCLLVFFSVISALTVRKATEFSKHFETIYFDSHRPANLKSLAEDFIQVKNAKGDSSGLEGFDEFIAGANEKAAEMADGAKYHMEKISEFRQQAYSIDFVCAALGTVIWGFGDLLTI
jgi:hypothetical protein